MAWLLGLVCFVTSAQAFLPSFSEIKDRTRWCLEEGAHCPVNLPFNIASCCKPYVCTAIPITRKPTMILKFTEYKDHRCLLPAVNETAKISSRVKPNQKENVEPTNENTGFNIPNSENESSSYSFNSTSELETSEEEDTSEDNETIKGHFLDKNNNITGVVSEFNNDEVEVKHVKRSILNDSNEVVVEISTKTSTLLFGGKQDFQNISFDVTTRNKSDKAIVLDSSSNEKSGQYDELSGTYNSTDDYSYFGPNNTMFNNQSLEINNSSYEEDTNETRNYLVSTNIPPLTLTSNNSEEETIEDWHSSDMHYDTRPVLHKVVTIHPFHWFNSVQEIPLNETIETSDDL